MAELKCSDVDLIRELRLRRWARRNYVPDEQRGETWHPIVLDEMRSKDAELENQTKRRPVGSSYVPLPPVGIHLLHGGHTQQVDPKLNRRAEATESLMQLGE